MSINVIGLSGKSGTGKDFIAQNYIIPLGYVQFSFAWHFKIWLVASGQATHEEVFVTKPPHVRKLIQDEGTARGREVYGYDIWCNVVSEWLRVLHEYGGINNFVIPDVRFVNEVECIHNLGGKVFRIHAPERVANSSLTSEARLHISETALDFYHDFDGIIYNEPWVSDTVKNQVYDLLGIKVES